LKSLLVILAFAFSLTGCAEHEAPKPRPDKYEVAVFSAPWCYPCKQQVPQVDAAAKEKGVKLTVYIVSGASPRTEPTQADADRYRQDLHLDAEVRPDPKYSLYKKYVPSGGYYVPMAASIDQADGSVSRVFGPGRLDMDLVPYIRAR
jgi:thiol-disulfide isomerase/thioredoxin